MARENQLQGERRWTAVLCADLVDFTGLSSKLGPEKTYELLGRVHGDARGIVERHGGHLIEYAGDAIYAVFGAPTATENASLEACRAALTIQTHMALLAQIYQERFGLVPAFRIGLDGGLVVFGSLGDGHDLDINVLGEAVNVASRLQSETPQGTVICSDAIYSQVEGYVEAIDNGPTRIRGLEGTRDTHRIVSLLGDVSAFEGRMQRGAKSFLGRASEIEALRDWTSTPRSPLIEITGPPGAGKSRIIHELVTGHSGAPRFLYGQCNLDTQNTPLAPIVEILRHALDWTKNSTRSDIETRLAALVDPEDPGFDYVVGRIVSGEGASAMGESESNRDTGIRRLFGRALEAVAARTPVVFLIEDVHWIDAMSEALIDLLIRSERASGACRFMTTRRAHMRCAWSNREDITTLALGALSRSDVSHLCSELLDARTVAPPLLDYVDRKSERNPLFVEEIVRFLQFSAAISVSPEGEARLVGAAPNIAAGNLQHLVLSRFDALPDAHRKLLAIAATRGRQFSTDFLQRASAEPEAAEACIDLARTEGLIERDPSRGPRDWRFSHALIREAIYEALLEGQRAEIHAQVADILESGETKAPAEELARHFQIAGNAPKAVDYLWRAAEDAYEIFAVMQVDTYLEAAFGFIAKDPDLVDDESFGRMLFLWGRTLDIYGQFRKLNDVMERHLPRLRAGENMEIVSLCMSMKALARCHAAHFDRAQDLLDESLAMAEACGEELAIIWAKVIQMRINVDSGRGSVDQTAQLYEEVLPVAQRRDDNHLIQFSTYVMMTAHRSVGALKRANEYLIWLEEYGRERKSTRAIAMVAWARCINHLVREEYDEAVVAARENLRLSVPETADWRVALVGQITARLGRGDQDVSPEDLRPHIKKLKAADDTTLGNAARVQYWIHTVSRGQFHLGWTNLARLKEEIRPRSAPEIQRYLELVQAEICMTVAGVLPRRSSGNKLGLRDLMTLLPLRLTGRKRALAHLERFKDMAPMTTGYHVARVERDLGMLAKASGDRSKAREHYARSIALYRNEDMFETAEQIEGLMAEVQS